MSLLKTGSNNQGIAASRCAGWLCRGLALFALGCCALDAFANNCTSTGGNWATAGSWANCNGVVPQALDTVTINAGTVTLNASPTISGLTVNGNLVFGDDATVRTLTVNGNISVPGGGSVAVANFTATHILNVSGNIDNAGTFDMALDFNSLCRVNFTGSAQTVSGSGATTQFNVIGVNLTGATTANIVDVTATNFSLANPNNGFAFTDGTFRLSTAVAITPAAAITIPANARFLINNAGATVNTAQTLTVGANGVLQIDAGSFVSTNTVAIAGTLQNSDVFSTTGNVTVSAGGTLRNDAGTMSATGATGVTVTGGTFNITGGAVTVGNAANESVILTSNAATTFLMSGGTLAVAGRLGSSSTAGDGVFNLSNGTITVGTVGNNVDNAINAPFFLGTAIDFTLSGGTIIIQAPNTQASAREYDVRATVSAVTGGTLQIGNAGTAAGQTFQINSVPAVWDLTVNAANSPTATLIAALTVFDDLTISGGTLNSVGFNITIGGGNASGQWLNNSGAAAFTAGAGTVTFTGTGLTQVIGGTFATSFNNLTVNKATGHVTISCGTPAPTVNATLTLTSGKIVTAGTSPACSTACSAQVPIIIGAAGTITGGSSTSYIQGALRKNFDVGDTLNFRATNGEDEFPIGDSANYTPVEIRGGTTSTAGNVIACMTATDHPQVASPVITTGIDAAKSLNRYWSFTTTTINTAAGLVNAIFKFNGAFVSASGDVDDIATVGNFVVQDWTGTLWEPTTLVTPGATSTRASNIDLSDAVNEFAIGEVLAGVTARPGRYNAFETSTTANAILGKIYTKVAGVPFGVDIVRVNANRNGVQATSITVEVAVFDASAGGVLDTNGCNDTAWTQILPAPANFLIPASGRGTIPNVTISNAYRDVRFRIRSPVGGPYTQIGCSTDRFAVRPPEFTSVISNKTNAGTSGTPSAIAGSGLFTLTAETGLTNYTGTPKIDNAALAAHVNAIQNGILSGAFPPAVAGTSTGTDAFTYSEVGNFRLLGSAATAGSTTARGVYDDNFAAVDQAIGDCTADFSNVLSSAKYGCKFGITANTNYFGRFYPDHFVLTPGQLTNRINTAGCTTTGTIAAANNFLTVASATGFAVGDSIVLRGAGAAGADLTAAINAIAGLVFTLNTSAVTAVTSARMYKSSLIHTYEGEALGVDFTLTARNGLTIPTTVMNYDPLAGFAAFDGATFANFNFGAIDTGSGTPLTSRLTGGVSSGGWSSGVGSFSANVRVSRGASADGPYETFSLGIGPQDPVDATVGLSSFNLDTAAPVGNDRGLVGSTRIRYGRLKIPNAYGSELLTLPLTVAAQYWNGSLYLTNTADTCTAIDGGNFTQNAGSGGVINTTIQGNGVLANGVGRIVLTKPSGFTTKGSVMVQMNPAIAPYLPGSSQATFGVYKRGPIIYLREMY